MVALAVDLDPRAQAVSQVSPVDGLYPARLLDSIQLLPQQAAMASILPTAVINKDIFPCKACGIWYRSERNLQAHLMYYCSGKQRESTGGSEDAEGGLPPLSNVCPFPQCSQKCSGVQSLETHLLTHGVTLEEAAGARLKCTMCKYRAESGASLQHHVLSHLCRVPLRCAHCHASFQNHRELLQHQDLHRLHGTGCTAHSPGGHDEGQKQAGAEPLNSRDVLLSPRGAQSEEAEVEKSEKKQLFSAPKGDVSAGSKASFSYTRIKSEPSSPRLASSPIQHSVGPTFPMGPFLSQFAFSQDLSMAPQASEILAKMSELVHRRLRQGRNSYGPMLYSPLVPKGATCFECNITFSNLDNYLVHKKHYCNNRWQQLAKSHDYSSLSDKVTDMACPNSHHSPSEPDNLLMQPTCLSSSVLDLISTSGKVPDKELPEELKKTSSPTGPQGSPSGQGMGSRSLDASPVESGNSLSKTTCEACKITFSRHETYMVHKQYYCASRHEPHARRTSLGKVPAAQRSTRSRKRKKVYELSPAEPDSKLQVQALFGLPPLGSPCPSQETVGSLGERFYSRYSVLPGAMGKHRGASLAVTKLVLSSKCNVAGLQEPDAPIDLSKKCSLQTDKAGSPSKRFLDYHECTVCKISFNKVDSYLAHKQNFCPVTASQHDDDTSLDKTRQVFPELKTESHFDSIFGKSALKCDISHNGNVFQAHLGAMSALHTTARLQLLPSKEESKNLFVPHCFCPRETKKANTPERVSPFYGTEPTDCVNGSVGSVAEMKEQEESPSEGSEGGQQVPRDEVLSMLPKSGDAATGLGGGLKTEEAFSSAPSPDESQSDDPQAQSSHGSPAWTSDSRGSPSWKSRTEKAAPIVARGLSSSGPASSGGSKYCHLCNLEFNSLSNFITHKKFYCSSRPTEHVK